MCYQIIVFFLQKKVILQEFPFNGSAIFLYLVVLEFWHCVSKDQFQPMLQKLLMSANVIMSLTNMYM